MGKEKGGFLTPKAIANRIKSKGLQKLRWFCQMCQKQCRDENGFKCHCMSESHQRQLLLFAENPDKYLDGFSQEFFDDFMGLLKRQFGTKRIHGNIVYQDYISFRDHTHMNATKWESLTEFVKWLGKEGHCVVDETSKGWFIQYIDRDPETVARQEAAAAKEKMALDDDERAAKQIQKQINKGKKTLGECTTAASTALQRENDEEKVQFNMQKSLVTNSSASTASTSGVAIAFNQMKRKSELEGEKQAKTKKSDGGKKKSALEEIMEEEKKRNEMLKARANAKKKNEAYALQKSKVSSSTSDSKSSKRPWLVKGIVVKIITKKLGNQYYNQKCVVEKVRDLVIANVRLQNNDDKIELNQSHVQTVIPKPGNLVLFVAGKRRSQKAIMREMSEKTSSVTVELCKEGRTGGGEIVTGIPFDDITRLSV